MLKTPVSWLILLLLEVSLTLTTYSVPQNKPASSAAATGRKNDPALQRETVTPKWRTNLKSAVGRAPLGLVVGQGRETKGKPHFSVMFTDNDTVIVSYVVREGEPELSKRDGSEINFPLRLRVVFLDANTGEIKTVADWPTESLYAAVVASQDGSFLTERGLLLTLYSPDLKESKRLRLPPTEDVGWEAHLPPTGHTILFLPAGLHTTPVPWIWIDVDELRIARTWQETQSGWVGIADNAVAMTTCVWVYDCEPRTEVKSWATEWKAIAATDRKSRPHPTFVDNEKLFLVGHSTEMVRTNGEVLFQEKSSDGCWWGQSISSMGGRRVAVPSCSLTGAVPALDREGSEILKRILLYDSPFDGLTYALDLKGPTIEGMTVLALSPDGSHLAVLNKETVEVLPLPSPAN